MTIQRAANDLLFYNFNKTLGQFTTGAASLLFLTSLAFAEAQVTKHGTEAASQSDATDGTAEAEYWEDPCGGPISQNVTTMS